MKTWKCLLTATVCLGLTFTTAHAEKYPSKPITLVVTASPGGVTDVLARTIGQHLNKEWGQPVIVENRPGASNQIGTEYVAKSTPDGYTMLVTAESTFVINPWIYSKLHYDPAKDFTPVSGLVKINQSLVTSPSLPVHNLNELIALAKKEPGQLNYGTFGIGSTGHLNMVMLEHRAGMKLVAVHYKGATPALNDVISNHIQMMFISAGSVGQYWKTGKVKLLAVGSSKRLARYPEVPTIAESGFPGFEAISWFGLYAPHGTPNDIVEKVNAAVQRVFDDAEFQNKLLKPHMFEPLIGTPKQFSDFVKSETKRWGEIVHQAKLKLN
jgi:tripartite-type tricarboxylate transporter receptor subunit TctC